MLVPSKDNVLMFVFILILMIPYFLYYFFSVGWYKVIVLVYGAWQSSMLMVFVKREFDTYGDKAQDIYRTWKKKK